MAGVSTDSGGKGGRRSLDSEINMIPMIDLLVCCISFLLITAVWSQMSRVNADAQVPGPPNPDKEIEQKPPEKMLHVRTQDDKFVLEWRQGATVVSTVDVAKKAVEIDGGKGERFPDLASKIVDEWKANGSHRDASDHKLDQAILHTDNKTPFREVIAVIDAIYAPKREQATASGKPLPAFNVTFSVN
jgi:biopolymer transport protein ExbD